MKVLSAATCTVVHLATRRFWGRYTCIVPRRRHIAAMGTYVVTGGARGIGRAVCYELAKQGHRIVLGYLKNHAAADQTVTQIRTLGGDAIAVSGDISQEESVLELFEQAQSLGQLSGVVNNAGIVAPSLPLVDVTTQRLRRMFDVNILGAYCVAREAARRMMISRGGAGGSIVNLSSVAATLGSPNEYVDYAGSKAAVDALTRGLALELAREGVRVNAVRPGLIETEIHASGGQPDRAQRLGAAMPMGRPGLAEEVADAVIWLLSSRSSYVTGALIDVSGGR